MSQPKRKAVATSSPRAQTYGQLRSEGYTSATIDFLMDHIYNNESETK